MKASDYDRLFDRFRHENDGEALARLFDLLAPDLLRLARSLSGRGTSAEDHVQSTFLVAIERRDRYRSEGRFFAWLAGILVNEIRRDRGRRNRRPDPQRLRSHLEEAAPASRAVEDDEAAVEINRALESMPEPYRGVLEMRLSQDLLPDEIAGRLGRRPGTVRSQLHRGLAMMRRCLPAGLAAFAFGVLPTGAALGAVRSVVTQRAGELALGKGVGLAGAGALTSTGAGMTAGVGVAAAVDSKVVILVVAAVLAVVPVAYVVMQDEDDDATLEEVVGEVESSSGPLRRDLVEKPKSADAPESSSVEAATKPASAAPALIPGTTWTETIHLFADNQPTDLSEVYRISLPEGVSRLDFKVWPMTVFGKEIKLEDGGDLRVEAPGKKPKLRHSSWNSVAVFLGTTASPYLHPLLLSGRSRFERVRADSAHWTSEARVAIQFLEDKKASNPVSAVYMRLWTKNGVVERAMTRQDKYMVTSEVVPRNLDVRVVHVDGLERVLHVPTQGRKPSSGLSFAGRNRLTRLTILDAEGGALVATPSVLAFTRHRDQWGESIPVARSGSAVFEVSHNRKQSRDHQLLVRAPGYYPRLMSLPKAKRNEREVHEVTLRRRTSRQGRLLDHRGEPMARARVNVISTTYGSSLLTCLTDENGSLAWGVATASPGRPKTRLVRESEAPFTVLIQDNDGGLALLTEVDSAALLAGADLRVPESPRRLRVIVHDEDGEPMPCVVVEVTIPGKHDERLGNPANRERFSNVDGLVDFGVLRAAKVVVTVQRQGFFPLQRKLDLPLADECEEIITWPELGKIQGRIPGLGAGLHKLLDLRLVKAGESTRSRGSVFVTTQPDEAGNFSFDVPKGVLFDLHASSNPTSTTDLTLRVITKTIPSVSAGDENLEVKIIRGRRVAIEVKDENDKALRLADLRWVADPLETESAWESAQEGFAGSFSRRNRKLLLPLGSATLTIVAQHKRVLRRTVTITEDTESLSFTLEAGARISGEVQGASNGVVILRLVNFDGADWPEPWLKPARAWNGYSKTTRIDGDGRFSSPALTPGRWEILVGRKLLRTIDLRQDIDLGVLDLGK